MEGQKKPRALKDTFQKWQMIFILPANLLHCHPKPQRGRLTFHSFVYSFLQNVAEAFRELVMTLDPLTLRHGSGESCKKVLLQGRFPRARWPPSRSSGQVEQLSDIFYCVFSFVEAGTERLIVMEEKPDVVE